MKASQRISTDDAFREANRFLTDERRTFADSQQRTGLLKLLLGQRTLSQPDLNKKFRSALHLALRTHAQRNELGLYRNDSLTLACLAIEGADFGTAVGHLLDVVFLDLNGATNALPGYKSFDRQTGGLVDFVISLLVSVLSTASIPTSTVESEFKKRWQTFSGFSKPPYDPERGWNKLAKRVNAS